MEHYTRVIREYSDISYRYTKGKIDIFPEKQFHPYYEIYFLLSRKVVFINDHIRKNLGPNHLAIIPPGEYHRFLVEEEDTSDYERCVLTIHPHFLGGTLLEEALSGKELLSLSPDHRIAQHFLYLKDAMLQNRESDFSYILSAVATDIIFLIKQQTTSLPHAQQGTAQNVAYAIMGYINENYKSNISLRDITEQFFLSVSSASHIFKEAFGMSIKKYIIEKRMNEIHICLQNGEKPQEVALDFGFSNYSTFYRSYCKHFGVPPSQTQRK